MGPQFSLRTLLVFVTIVAAFCALFVYSPVLFVLAAVPSGIYALAWYAKFWGLKIDPIAATVFAVLALIVVAILLPSVQSPGRPSRRAACSNNLKVLARSRWIHIMTFMVASRPRMPAMHKVSRW